MLDIINFVNYDAYWNTTHLTANFIIILNLLGSACLGFLLGYERIYQGRAAGMRTYALVCMASCALTVFAGYSSLWFGGFTPGMSQDPTRVIQGIVTGVGFLGAGVIMKEGMSISGLSTAASIWLCCAIGVLVGVGFYMSAIALTGFAVLNMIIVSKFEHQLPQKRMMSFQVKFKKDFLPVESKVIDFAKTRGYNISLGSLSINTEHNQQEWHFMAYTNSKQKALSIADMSNELSLFENVESFTLTPVRN